MSDTKQTNKKHIAHLEQVRRQTITIKWIFGSVVALVVLLLLYGYLNTTVLVPYKTVATVNGTKISASKFQSTVKLQRISSINTYTQYYQFAQQLGIADPVNDPTFGQILAENMNLLTNTDQMGEFVIEKLIKEELIAQEAERRGINISEDDLQGFLNESYNFFPNGTPTAIPSVTPFSTNVPNPTSYAIVTITPTPTALPTGTPTTVPEVPPTPTQTLEPVPTEIIQPTPTAVNQAGFDEIYKAQVEDFKTEVGVDEEGFRSLYREYLLREALMKDVTKDMKPFADRVWARHILVATEDEAKAVLARLEAGEDFAVIAAELSLDTSNKDRGGDLGWFGKGEMVPTFEEAAFSIEIGSVSQPVGTDYGFHIIQVIGHEEQPLAEAEFENAKQIFFDEFLQTLRDEATVEINDVWKTIVPTEPALQ
ncbi:MAG TPA: peptidylprolyl isomerase [Anaerolineales bacterium]|nr:peptidylprolyl isomerase [Anaerolineales bacterium]